jgi:hypothetical protein
MSVIKFSIADIKIYFINFNLIAYQKNPKIVNKFLKTTIISLILFIIIYNLLNSSFLNLKTFLQ